MLLRRGPQRWMLISIAIIIALLVVVLLLRSTQGTYIRVGKPVDALALSPDGRTLATTSANGLQIWNSSDQQLLQTVGDARSSGTVAWSPDGQFVAVQGPEYTVRVWRVSDGALSLTLRGHTLPASTITFSPNGSVLASASGDHTIRFWQMREGALIPILREHTRDVDDIAFSPDGQTVALHRVDGAIQIWQLPNERLRQTLTGGQTAKMLFSPDGRLLAALVGEIIQVWRIADGTLVYRLDHRDWVNSLAFSPNGELLAAGAGNTNTSDDIKDTTVRVWRMNDGSLVKVLEGHGSVVRSVVFSPDGQALVSGSWDGTVRFWPVQEQ